MRSHGGAGRKMKLSRWRHDQRVDLRWMAIERHSPAGGKVKRTTHKSGVLETCYDLLGKS